MPLPSWCAAAGDDRGVLITAEPGLDAEAVARAIHQRSARRAQPFVALACDGAVGAGTREATDWRSAASQDRSPRKHFSVECAVRAPQAARCSSPASNEMPAPLQRRLARLLRDGEVRVARRAAPMALDVRVIAAVEDRLDAGLREELLRRLPLTVEVPAAAAAAAGRAGDCRGDARRRATTAAASRPQR